jgi:hypothetical protein
VLPVATQPLLAHFQSIAIWQVQVQFSVLTQVLVQQVGVQPVLRMQQSLEIRYSPPAPPLSRGH